MLIMTRLSNCRGRIADAAAPAIARVAALFKPREPANWLEKRLRMEAVDREASRRLHAETAYILTRLWKRLHGVTLGGLFLTSYIRDAFVYPVSDGAQISIYPAGAMHGNDRVEFETCLLAALDMTVVERKTAPYGLYSQTVEVTFTGPSALGKTDVRLYSVPAGPSCRVVERKVVEPAREVTKYEIECVGE